MRAIIKIVFLVLLPLFVCGCVIFWHHYYRHQLFNEPQEFFVTHDNYNDFMLDVDSLIYDGSFSDPLNQLTLHSFIYQKRLRYKVYIHSNTSYSNCRL